MSQDHLYKSGKGWTGNAKGRPKGSKNRLSIAELQDAIETVEKQKGKKKLLVHYVERAYADDTVLCNLMKKMLPDLKSVEVLAAALDMPDDMAEEIKARLRERFGCQKKERQKKKRKGK